MIETYPAPASNLRHELVTASYAHLAAAGRPGAESLFTDQTAFWNESDRVAGLDLAGPDPAGRTLADLEAAATWWPAILVVLLAAMAGLALFGVL